MINYWNNAMTVTRHFTARLSLLLIITIYVTTLKQCEGYPTTTGTSPTDKNDGKIIAIEIEVTENPLQSIGEPTEPENEVENAATELAITFDTESLNNNTLAYFDSDNDDGTTFSPTPPPPFLEPIVEMEVTDTNNAAEELDQATYNVTHIIEGEVTEEPHPDKKEILNELQNIWYYTNELGDDQNALKSSLSSLVHMTYARVYDQSDETLLRLKYLLRKLRARLLEQSGTTEIDSDPIIPTTMSTLDGISDNISITTTRNENGDISNHHTFEQSANQTAQTRDKRSINDQQRRMEDKIIFADSDPDENSLFPSSSDNNRQFLYSQSNRPKIPTIFESHSSEATEKRKVVGVENSNNLDDMTSNFVHITILQPDKKNGSIKFNPTSTMSSSSPSLFSSLSHFSSGIKSPTNIKYDNNILHYNVTQLKEKYKTTQKPNINSLALMEESSNNNNNSSFSSISSMDEIIQSIIDVLGTPIQKPIYSHSIKNPGSSLSPIFIDKNLNNSIIDSSYSPVSFQNQPVFDNLPAYLEQLAAGLGLGNFPSKADNEGNFTKVAMVYNPNLVSIKNNNGTTNDSAALHVLDESVGDDLVLLAPTTVVNGTMEKVIRVINMFTNLPNAARFVLFFSITISIASIALGLYSLGPPIVAVGVLGLIVPILLLFLLQSSAGKKKKAKHDILNQLKIDDFFQALDMIADAMIKYDKI